MSDFCLVDEACQARLTIGEGARAVVRVCKMVKLGSRETIRIEPFIYLYHVFSNVLIVRLHILTQSHMSGNPKLAQGL